MFVPHAIRRRCYTVSLFGEAAFLHPGLNLVKRRAERRSTLAGGHRRRRREAACVSDMSDSLGVKVPCAT